MKKLQKCYECGGELDDYTVNDYKEEGVNIIIIKDVPCQKCVSCGEVIFNFNSSLRIEKMIDELKDSLTGKITVVQYSEDKIEAVQYREAESITKAA